MADNTTPEAGHQAPHDPEKTGNVPQAVLVRRKRTHVSVVWLIPVLAALVALGVAIQRILAEGPTVTIEFAAGQGIEAGKTQLKYKDITIGQVASVDLDNHTVRVTARIKRSAAALMVKGTDFWVVSPHIGLNGISGLETLLSGVYIGVRPGTSSEAMRRFTGLNVPPQITDQQGQRWMLRAADLGSLEVGSPIYYRFMPVGQVESIKLADDHRSFDISAFINAPYDQEVHSETRFWNASGLDVSIGENGVEVKTVSLQALLAGGLGFDTPDFAVSTPAATPDTTFKISPSRAVAMKQPEKLSHRYVLSFHEPVRGLSVGASVTLMGLVVGEVSEIGLHYNPQTLGVHPLVHITFYPEQAARLFPSEQQGAVRRHTEPDLQMVAMLRRLVDERGMRARLRSASLLTGQRYVSFEFDAKAPPAKVDWTREPLQLPVAPGEIEDLEAKLESILGKVDQMPIAAIGERTSNALKTLNQALHHADLVVQDVDTSTLPKVRKALEDLDRVLDNANATFVGKDAPGQEALREALEEVANTARSLRALTDYLERHPEALIRGRVGEKK